MNIGLLILMWIWATAELLIWFKMPKTQIEKIMVGLFFTAVVFLFAASTARSQERTIPVELTQAQWNTVAKSISKEPFGEVVVIMSEIQRQVGAAIAREAADLMRLKVENEQLREGRK